MLNFARTATMLTLAGLACGVAISLTHAQAVSDQQTIIAEFGRYHTAIRVFSEKYHALPGDIANATDYWGDSVKNGDGDGKIGISEQAETYHEVMQFWTHLANAGLIKGSYSGISGPGETGYHAIIGENVPASTVEGGGWSLHPDIGEAKNNPSRYDGYYGSYLFFGRQTNRAVTYGEILSANQMAAIDAKIDDGKPATGQMVAAKPGLSPNCADKNDLTAQYRQSDAPNACHIVFKDVAGLANEAD